MADGRHATDAAVQARGRIAREPITVVIGQGHLEPLARGLDDVCTSHLRAGRTVPAEVRQVFAEVVAALLAVDE